LIDSDGVPESRRFATQRSEWNHPNSLAACFSDTNDSPKIEDEITCGIEVSLDDASPSPNPGRHYVRKRTPPSDIRHCGDEDRSRTRDATNTAFRAKSHNGNGVAMLVANDAVEKTLLVPLYCNHGRHALKQITAKDEVVNECCRGMT
jgi:hypothetical protein